MTERGERSPDSRRTSCDQHEIPRAVVTPPRLEDRSCDPRSSAQPSGATAKLVHHRAIDHQSPASRSQPEAELELLEPEEEGSIKDSDVPDARHAVHRQLVPGNAININQPVEAIVRHASHDGAPAIEHRADKADSSYTTACSTAILVRRLQEPDQGLERRVPGGWIVVVDEHDVVIIGRRQEQLGHGGGNPSCGPDVLGHRHVLRRVHRQRGRPLFEFVRRVVVDHPDVIWRPGLVKNGLNGCTDDVGTSVGDHDGVKTNRGRRGALPNPINHRRHSTPQSAAPGTETRVRTITLMTGTGHANRSVTTVIPARDAAETLGRQLGALANQSHSQAFQTVVVANNCSDDTIALARSFESVLDLRVIEANDGIGASYARNVGVRATSSDIVLHCDADDVVSSRWVADLCEGLEQADVVGGRLVLPRTGGPWWFHDRGVYDLDGLPASRSVRFTLACSMGYRRSVFEEIGGFDDRLTHGCDDLLFCLLAQRAGRRIGFVDGAEVQYRPRSGRRAALQQRYSFGSGEATFRALHTPCELRPPAVEFASSFAGILRSLSAAASSPSRRPDHLARAAERWGRLRGQAEVWRHRQWPSRDLRGALARPPQHRRGSTQWTARRWGPYVREVTADISLPVIGGRLFEMPALAAVSSQQNERSVIPTLEFLQSTLTEGDTFIDVGAGVGHIAAAAAVLVGRRGRVAAIEPDVQLHPLLSTNVRRVRGGDVEILQRLEQQVPDSLDSTGLVVVARCASSALYPDFSLMEESRAVSSADIVIWDIDGLSRPDPELQRLFDQAQHVFELSPDLWLLSAQEALLGPRGWRSNGSSSSLIGAAMSERGRQRLVQRQASSRPETVTRLP